MKTPEVEVRLERSARRSFVGRLAMLLGISATVGGTTAITSPNETRKESAPSRKGSSPDQIGTLEESYLKPGFVPRGYRFSHLRRGIHDGFNGQEEIRLVYRHPKFDWVALMIFMTKAPNRHFQGTEGVPPQKLDLTLQDGRQTVGLYYDGYKQGDGFSSTDMHALVFQRGDVHVGIRGWRSAEVGLEEFRQIAASLS
jgi:hypothetical protein